MTNKKQKSEREIQRQLMVIHLRILLEELEGRPARFKSDARFPFNLLETAVYRGILHLEGLIARLVKRVLGFINEIRRQQQR